VVGIRGLPEKTSALEQAEAPVLELVGGQLPTALGAMSVYPESASDQEVPSIWFAGRGQLDCARTCSGSCQSVE
jgi:hypothetical protein